MKRRLVPWALVGTEAGVRPSPQPTAGAEADVRPCPTSNHTAHPPAILTPHPSTRLAQGAGGRDGGGADRPQSASRRDDVGAVESVPQKAGSGGGEGLGVGGPVSADRERVPAGRARRHRAPSAQPPAPHPAPPPVNRFRSQIPQPPPQSPSRLRQGAAEGDRAELRGCCAQRRPHRQVDGGKDLWGVGVRKAQA